MTKTSKIYALFMIAVGCFLVFQALSELVTSRQTIVQAAQSNISAVVQTTPAVTDFSDQLRGEPFFCIAPNGEKRFTESECAPPTATSEVRP